MSIPTGPSRSSWLQEPVTVRGPQTDAHPLAGIDLGSFLQNSPSSNPASGPAHYTRRWGIPVIGSEEIPVIRPIHAVEEKPQIQALDRTAPTLPMLPGTPSARPMSMSETAPQAFMPR